MEITFINDEYSPNLDEAITFARKQELKYIELRNIDGKNVTDLTIDSAYAYADKITSTGILVSALVTPFLYWYRKENNFGILGQQVDSQEEYFIKLMDLADIFGARYISIYSYLQDDSLTVEELGKQLDEYSQMALERGIELLLNIDDKCNINNINKMHQLFENYNFSNIHPLINTGKIIALNDDYKQNELQDIINICHYFHLSDYDSELKRYVTLGEGNVDFEVFLQDKINDDYTITSLNPATSHSQDLAMSFNQLVDWLD